jgi:hypothetical protein
LEISTDAGLHNLEALLKNENVKKRLVSGFFYHIVELHFTYHRKASVISLSARTSARLHKWCQMFKMV